MRDTDLAITFFTFLTLLANAATLSIAGTAGAARLTGRPAARRAWANVHREVAGGAVGLAWLVAAVAMSGSLYFSEVAGFTPCRLCWAQRACMYPLVALLAVAGLTRRPAWRALSLALATVGAGIAVYHVLVERFPTLESGTCDPANPCSLVWFERFGFVTLPYMALSGFVLIGALLLTAGVRAPAPAEPAGPAKHGTEPARLATGHGTHEPAARTNTPHRTTATGAPTTTTSPPAVAPVPTTEPSASGIGPQPGGAVAGALAAHRRGRRWLARWGATSGSGPGSSTTAGIATSTSLPSSTPTPSSVPAAPPARTTDATALQENRS